VKAVSNTQKKKKITWGQRMSNDELEKLADETKENGDVNLAIVLYVYLGSKKANLGGLFAKHCQDFAESGLKEIKRQQLKRN
jgi:hypothetical protein